MNDRSADRFSELLSAVMGFCDPVLLVDRIIGVGCGIQNVVIAVAVNLVGAALGHSVHESAASLSKLRFEPSAGDLKLADHVLAELVGNAGASNLLREESVVVVSAIHRVVVEVPGNTVEADHPEVAIGRRSRGQQGEIGEVSSVRGKRLYAALVHDRAKRRRSGINQWGLGAHNDRGVDLADRELRMDDCSCSHSDGDVFEHDFAESAFLDRDFVSAGIEVEECELAFSGGPHSGGNSGVLISYGDLSVPNCCSRRIGHRSFQPSRSCG